MISKDEILHVATLANLKFQPDEVDSFVDQLDKIVNMESKLSSVDTTGIEPTYNMGDTSTVFREDKGIHTQTREQMLENVPETDNNLIKVPTIVDKEDDE
ncbi:MULTISPECIES: Asp-tRNA(Asn)/Glu-tRNA(Gln) amidotransferase subunit GatC [Companilactobacillus]|jgi:aspartyl-tRNA(Asn)/glutamyl-tRNA(Gln) amidotransferase subunit C|uniref:Aspartyl/glutamyl-tRNA(Asn/Gln) amidotransferase subunit C n=4 Tax=Companilactobacillus TaxID=2767879 RepID=A0A0H4LBY3_9LACO|nr:MULTISPECIES: Asp-tRNA(Asn)/Glu-tRNA(Gln) amidotransferase subunit GatC [Companilactobacillus]AKP03321.1 glutamyl-tRNA amidotransferase [Companilactobacillus farciminis]AKS51620.1 glutamyl-tRNA amidotransferase [Companilactobacillus farciminis]KRK96616.1 aspartyl glutamyl-tRNA(Asn Gln) amidotransferase subunit C [Companilactobacillus futsaii JCM 17355]MDG5112427.1 Asp-tRNA(Asn)/Glu-tRNA(Gln) amidotransferase subunit GatC [Companilactobacillus pabuli]QCX24092.1 Asp-tRNA(Asn)/Glu-tRNA(Gln) am